MPRIALGGSVKVDLSYPYKGKACALIRLLNNSGYELTTKKKAEFLIAIDHNRGIYNKFLANGGSPSRTILIRLEPPTVFPSQYKELIFEKYARVISPGSLDLLNSNPLKYGWPYEYHFNPNFPQDSDPSLSTVLDIPKDEINLLIQKWKDRQILLTMIASNKVSATRSENYSLRRRVALELINPSIEVYGPLWNENLISKIHHRLAVTLFSLRQGVLPDYKSIYGNLFRNYPNAKGSVQNKHSILQQSKFTLVIENSNFTVTEKLFDAIVNGAVPIYVGPDLARIGLPENIAVCCDGEPKTISDILNNLSQERIFNILEAGQEFLRSDQFRKSWVEESVYESIFLEVDSFVKSFKDW